MGFVHLHTFTLSREWQVSPPIQGEIFRVRHPANLFGNGLICQASLNGTEVSTFDIRETFANKEPEIFLFNSFYGVTERRLALRSVVQDNVPWVVHLEQYVLDDTPTDLPVLASALSNYLLRGDWLAALETLATHSELTAAMADKVTSAQLAVALANKVTDQQLLLALTNMVRASELTAALANKVTTAQLAEAIANTQKTLTLTAQTINANPTDMVTPQRVLIQPNSSVGYEISLVGHSMAATPEFIYWLGSGAVYRGPTAASTVLVGATGTRRASVGNGSNWGPLIAADTVNGGLKIQVKGDGGKTIKWVAQVKLNEVW